MHPRLGCFLEMGLGRQLLLPIRELPELEELRPQVGDEVFVIMEHDKQGRLRAKLAGERELAPLAFHAPTTWVVNEWVEALVYKPLDGYICPRRWRCVWLWSNWHDPFLGA